MSKIIEYLDKLAKTSKEGGICHTAKRATELQEKLKFFKSQLAQGKLSDEPLAVNHTENHLFGISLSSTKACVYDMSAVTHQCKDFFDGVPSENYTFGVEILSENRYVTKGGKQAGKTRADLVVADKTGKIKVKVWADLYERVSDLCAKGNSIILTGSKGAKFYSEFLIASQILQAK